MNKLIFFFLKSDMTLISSSRNSPQINTPLKEIKLNEIVKCKYMYIKITTH